ncbi:AAA family ATPase [Nocardiopsis aegyptia]|uniref:Wobble nucleotide-excising tRNase n=1 Tax=Nocardiopsis aegyptia TaxID=220378 RepID=A0A7Z0EJA2_9ACTN|nr:AAA family ATPase [Nocardiopsis aegyptia]NYJ33041.1 wobble nucleotide-excising tRNase [Nocardiopsis aegyptia]
MIKRIISVRDFRCYQSWKPHRKAAFHRLNLVYAPNGTGKSTLAELLSGVPRDEQWSHGMRVEIQPGDDPSQTVTVDGPEHWIWDNVRLFNAEYVRRNLRFNADDGDTAGADAPALLYLGEKDVERQERRKQAQQEIERLTQLLKESRKERDSADREAGDLCTALGRRVNDTLRGKAPCFSRQFDKRHVVNALAEPPPAWAELHSTHEQDRALLNTASAEQIPPVDPDPLPVGDVLSQTCALLARTVASEAVAGLRDRPDHETWVRRGLELHADLDTCAFCEGDITPQRRERLDRHFDEAYTRLLRDLDESLRQIRRLRDRAKEFSTALPHEAQFFEDLREEYAGAAKEIHAALTALVDDLDRMSELLEEKKTAMFADLNLPVDVVPGKIDTSMVNGIIGEHNDRTHSLESGRAEAAERQFQRMLREIREPWGRHRDRAAELTARIDDAEGALRNNQEILRQSPAEGLDPHHLVSTLNTDVNSLLRRADLTFEYHGDRYRLLRHGTPARHLSEGEKTAIALVYFLVSLTGHGQDLQRTIVVVDDPVSSLDDQVMTGVQSMLVSQLDPLSPQPPCRQLFVLTHNAAFLRMWAKELTRGRGNRNPNKFVPVTASLHMMKSTRRGSTTEPGSRRPELTPVDLATKNIEVLESEYHRLFYQVAHDLLESCASIDVEADLRLITESSNSTRQLLEHFLEFSYPNQAGKFVNVVEHALKNEPVRARRISTLLNSNSHRSPDPEGKELLSDEARGAITDVFRLMNEVNPGHFDGMCNRLGIGEHTGMLLSD